MLDHQPKGFRAMYGGHAMITAQLLKPRSQRPMPIEHPVPRPSPRQAAAGALDALRVPPGPFTRVVAATLDALRMMNGWRP
jgi:hypothetical protein